MRIVISVSIIAATLLGVCAASATEVGPYGAFWNRGQWVHAYRLQCDAGSYVVGVIADSGAWVDRLRITCAHWDGRTNVLDDVRVINGRTGSSTGGSTHWANCPRQTVISSYEEQTLQKTGDVAAIDNLRFNCVSTRAPHNEIDTADLLTQDSSFDASNRGWCPRGEFVTGIFGEADMYVRTVGLTCSPAPARNYTPQTPGGMSSETNGRIGPSDRTRAQNQGPYTNPTMPIGPPADFPPRGPTRPTQAADGYHYAYPHIRSAEGTFALLDWCREWGSNCGQAAANAFCATQRMGSGRAVGFAQFTDAGRFRETVIISTRASCTDHTCDGFTFVTCGF